MTVFLAEEKYHHSVNFYPIILTRYAKNVSSIVCSHKNNFNCPNFQKDEDWTLRTKKNFLVFFYGLYFKVSHPIVIMGVGIPCLHSLRFSLQSFEHLAHYTLGTFIPGLDRTNKKFGVNLLILLALIIVIYSFWLFKHSDLLFLAVLSILKNLKEQMRLLKMSMEKISFSALARVPILSCTLNKSSQCDGAQSLLHRLSLFWRRLQNPT